MARGKSGDAATLRMFNSAALQSVSLHRDKGPHVQSAASIRQAIDRNWESMPPQAQAFLLDIDALDFSLHKLARFWSAPSVVEYTRGGIAGKSVCGASWFIALNYLKLGKIQAARILTLNGSFIHQCFNTPIESIVALCGPQFNRPLGEAAVPIFSRGMAAVATPPAMEAYLQKGLPKRYQHMMTNLVNISSPDNVMDYVDQIGDDWSGAARGRPRQPAAAAGEKRVRLVLADAAGGARRAVDVGAATRLRAFFDDVAARRGVSLRSLRFSYDGATLFLSAVGNRTPEEMHMRDDDVVTVHDTTAAREACADSATAQKPQATKHARKKANARRKKKKHEPQDLVKTLGEYKAQHSRILSRLHEEVGPQLKEIRTRLNARDLERQPPKKKKKRKKKQKQEAAAVADLRALPAPGVGGKAGRPFFAVQVGEVGNLYKTTKPSARAASPGGAGRAATLDLHGLTREEALVQLERHLPLWVDRAMRGSYPFVRPATIVCGCGNQVLSDTVEQWIRRQRNVCNAPLRKVGRALGYC